MKRQADVVVIGGGIAGCSLLYHLTRLGVGDCMLLEKHELTAGTTWHSAALLGDFSQYAWQAFLHQRTRHLHEELERETGQPIGFHRTGSIRLALNADEMAEGRRFAGMAKFFGIACELITPDDVKKLHPLVSLEGVLGATYTLDDGYVDAAMITQAYATAARQGGAEIHRHTPVTGLRQRLGGKWEVETEKGTITAAIVVNAAGIWGNEIAAMVGVSLPLVPVELSYVVTDAIPEVDALETELPILRGLDGSYYLRQEREGVLIGVYEDAPVFWATDGVPADFGQDLLPGDLDRVARSLTSAMERVPVFSTAGIKNLICGPAQRTPDFRALMGPMPGVTNFFSYVGLVSGFAQGSGLSESMAQWIVRGRPDQDLGPHDLRRFGPYADRRYTIDRVTEAFTHGYSVFYPGGEHKAGRPLKTSPIHGRLSAQGAVFAARNGWECPLMFVRHGPVVDGQPTFGRPDWFDHVDSECRAVHDAAGVLDLTAMAKFEVSGASAEDYLNHLCASPLPTEEGGEAEGLMLNTSGGIECSVSVTRLGPQRFFVTGPASAEGHHLDWLCRHLPEDGSVSVDNVTERDGVLLLAGPRSPDILAELTGDDFSEAAIPPQTARPIEIGIAGVRAHCHDALGEIGWELHHSLEVQETLYDSLMAAGEAHGITDFGLRAQSSLLLEVGAPRWKIELTVTTSPLEAGLDGLVDPDKGEFIGRAAVIEQRRQGISHRLAGLAVDIDAGEGWLWGDEAIFHDGRAVALTLSAGYGHRVCKNIALATLPTDVAQPGTALEVEVLGERLAATVVAMPF